MVSKVQAVGACAKAAGAHALLALLQVDAHVSMMHIHVFATYFGLMVAWFLSRSLNETVVQEKTQTEKRSSLFTMLGEDKVGLWGVGWGGSQPGE